MKNVIITLIVLGAVCAFSYFGYFKPRMEASLLDEPLFDSSATTNHTVNESPAKSVAVEARSTALALLEKCRALDASEKRIYRRLAYCESQFELGGNFMSVGNFEAAKEVYDLTANLCNKLLSANQQIVNEAQEKIRAQFAETSLKELKKLPMPGKDEIEVTEASLVEAIKEGSDAADLLAKAEYSEFGSERYVFAKGAFGQAVKEKDGSVASEALQMLMDGIDKPDYTALVAFFGDEAKSLCEEDDDLERAYRLVNLRVEADKIRAQARKILKKNPADTKTRQAVAEALIILGEWDLARKQFNTLEGGYKEAFAAEDDNAGLFEAAGFWWDCPQKGHLKVTPFYKDRAIMLYKRFLGRGSPTEEQRALAEGRILKRLIK